MKFYIFAMRWRAVAALAFLVIGASLCAQAVEISQRDSVKLLTVGNSFADDATFYLPGLAEAAGKELVLFKANLPGCPLERHARHLGEDATDLRRIAHSVVLGRAKTAAQACR